MLATAEVQGPMAGSAKIWPRCADEAEICCVFFGAVIPPAVLPPGVWFFETRTGLKERSSIDNTVDGTNPAPVDMF